MRIPKHVGIIPDGNRRWAKGNGLKKEQGYDHGLTPGVKVLQQAQAYGIEELTFYGFTVDNCKRPKEQLTAFKQACVEAAKLMMKEKVSLLILGNTKSKCFPEELLDFTKRTNFNGGGTKVNILVNYGWEWDLSKKSEEANKSIRSSLYSSDISRIDLIIRWGNMNRLSGFLPIQSVYSDIYVVKELWPDFKTEHLEEAIRWYDKQDVTLGG
ncbi:polyprenyl diphosphate synthase [Anaeromicropila populeti]|nr:polyprenyl diphosphate synthase [Anaeromicropila populeti]